jgi:peptide chain release factor 1
MFENLEEILIKYEDITMELSSPDVTSDQRRFRNLMKEQSSLTPLVEAYKAYKKANQDIEDSLMMLEEESDDEMREMLKEELNGAKKRVEELESELKILLLPKDPNDDKNVIVEIRAGAGGDEHDRRRAEAEVRAGIRGFRRADRGAARRAERQGAPEPRLGAGVPEALRYR